MPTVGSLLTTAFSGDVIVQFAVAAVPNLEALASFIDVHLTELDAVEAMPAITRLIRSRTWVEVEALEADAALTTLPPLASLNSFYRVSLRHAPHLGAGLVAALLTQPGIVHAWLELRVRLAADPADDPDARRQLHLRKAPDGIAVAALWRTPGGDGRGTHLYDLEHGWRTSHADLLGHAIGAPVYGDDVGASRRAPLPAPTHPPSGPATGALPKDEVARRVNHGTSVLGVVVATDDAVGGIGIVPSVGSVNTVSCFDAATGVGEHVADAVLALVGRVPRWSVLLLEVQRDLYPTEVDDADFHALRLAASSGIVVVEPAGNGGVDLDQLGAPVGFLDRSSPAYRGDSGAILVAAVGDTLPRLPLVDTNRGTRVDVCAQGMNVVTAGADIDAGGGLILTGGNLDQTRRHAFGRTSAAAAIIAGAALGILGVERAAGQEPPSSLDVRRWLNACGPTLPGLGALPDLARLAQVRALGPASPPLRLSPAPPLRTSPAPAHQVSNPQTSEGNSNLISGSGVHVGDVRLPPLGGGAPPHSAPGQPPPAAGVWTEHWVIFDRTQVIDAGLGFRIRHVSPPPTTNPVAGTWSDAVRNDYRNAHPGAHYAEVRFSYASPPGPLVIAAEADLDDTAPGVVLHHHKIERVENGVPVKVGELRRRRVGDEVRDRWMLYDTYRLPGYGSDVLLRPSALPAGINTAQWLADNYAAYTGANAPRPLWYVNVRYTIASL